MNKLPIIVIGVGIILTLAGIVVLSNLEDDAIETAEKGVLYEDNEGTIKITGEKDAEPHLYVHIKSTYDGGELGGFNERHGNGTWNLTKEDCDLVKTFTLNRNDTYEQVFIPKCSYIEDDGESKDRWIVVGTLCKQWNEDKLKGEGCLDGTYTWDSKGEEVMVYDLDYLEEAFFELILKLVGSFGAICCGIIVLIIGIILAFTMVDPQDTYMGDNQDSNLFNQAAAETGLKSSSGWDEKEDYIRKDSTEEVEETKEEAPETDQREGEYKIPPPE